MVSIRPLHITEFSCIVSFAFIVPKRGKQLHNNIFLTKNIDKLSGVKFYIKPRGARGFVTRYNRSKGGLESEKLKKKKLN